MLSKEIYGVEYALLKLEHLFFNIHVDLQLVYKF